MTEASEAVIERSDVNLRFLAEPKEEQPVVVEAEERSDGMVDFSGYLLRWGDIAHIRDFIGEYDETFERGAFEKTFRQRGPKGNNAIKVMRMHNLENYLAGKFTDLHEDDIGPAFSARTVPTDTGRNVAVEIREGVIDTMSIGFRVPKGGDRYDKERNLFTVRECMMLEGSPVYWPAYSSATIDNFRSLADMLPAFERFMTVLESGGTLRDEQIGQLTLLRSRISAILDGPPEAPEEETEEDNEIDGSVNDHASSRVRARLRLLRLRGDSPYEEGRFGFNHDQRHEEGRACT